MTLPSNNNEFDKGRIFILVQNDIYDGNWMARLFSVLAFEQLSFFPCVQQEFSNYDILTRRDGIF